MYEWEFLALKCNDDLTNGEDVHSGMVPMLDRNYNEFAASIESRDFIDNLVWGVIDSKDKIDDILVPAAPEWPIDQIALVDLVILRMGVYELLFASEVPPKVAINEAVELAKAFGGEHSSRFVNGVLGTIFRASDKYDPAEDNHIKKTNGENQTKKVEDKK
jgi:N utilization substance protein B